MLQIEFFRLVFLCLSYKDVDSTMCGFYPKIKRHIFMMYHALNTFHDCSVIPLDFPILFGNVKCYHLVSDQFLLQKFFKKLSNVLTSTINPKNVYRIMSVWVYLVDHLLKRCQNIEFFLDAFNNPITCAIIFE
jgi:hypothetical protein